MTHNETAPQLNHLESQCLPHVDFIVDNMHAYHLHLQFILATAGYTHSAHLPTQSCPGSPIHSALSVGDDIDYLQWAVTCRLPMTKPRLKSDLRVSIRETLCLYTPTLQQKFTQGSFVKSLLCTVSPEI